MADQFTELLGMTPATIDGGKLTFVQGSLHSTLSIWKERYDRSAFGWMVHTDYTGLRERMAPFGGAGVRIDHPSPSGSSSPTNIPPAACYLWPVGGDPLASEVAVSVTRYGPSSLHFVRETPRPRATTTGGRSCPPRRGLVLRADKQRTGAACEGHPSGSPNRRSSSGAGSSPQAAEPRRGTGGPSPRLHLPAGRL